MFKVKRRTPKIKKINVVDHKQETSKQDQLEAYMEYNRYLKLNPTVQIRGCHG